MTTYYNFTVEKNISLEQIARLAASQTKIELDTSAVERIKNCKEYLDDKINKSDEAFYGINTGFGSLCNTVVSKSDLSHLQENLLMSHACGTGNYVPKEIVRLMLLLKIRSLCYGHSGVNLATVERLVYFYNNDILPVVYDSGSLGASGDLAPLAHLCLPLIGKGEMWEGDAILAGSDVLRKHNLLPLTLGAKEGLALINGTQFMAAYGVYILQQSKKLSKLADIIAALSCDAFLCRREPFSLNVALLRPHQGHIETALVVSKYLQDSELNSIEKKQVQDPYSFRCIPQVHGASKDSINYVNSVFETEINAVTDNPNIFAESDEIISAGNFHGQPLALTLDFLAIALAELGNISERRLYLLLSGQRDLPAFLTPNPGLHSGFMIVQYSAAALVSRNKQLCTPASVDSIVSSNGQEDHVSMGANAAVKALDVLKNLESVLACELLAAAQALDFRKPMKPSPILHALYLDFREQVPFVAEDVELYKLMKNSVDFMKNANI
jgi:histidine ammonia-lyase